MTYISMKYYILVLAVLFIYYLLPLKKRWVALLLGNVAFYYIFYKTGWWIFGLTIGIAYAAGLLIYRIKENARKLVLYISLVAIITPWLLIKNSSYFLDLVNLKNTIVWIVPLGISFYTLQLIAYVVDVYRKRIVPEKNIFRFVLFASFFPQLIQGPIPRYEQLQEQLITGHKFEEKNIVKGFLYIVWGFFLKLMIADKAVVIVNTVYDGYPAYSGVYLWIAIVLYSVQLYADFLACTTLAQGVSKLFGIELIDNFARPFFADSIKDFWRRWHISLSTWLKDYIYIPLGGNRKGKNKKYLFLLITFLVSGLWHGTGYHYLVWGCLQAIYQIGGELSYEYRERIYGALHVSTDSKVKRMLKQIGTYFLFIVSLVIFKADSLHMGVNVLGQMFSVFNPWILFNDQIFELGIGWKDMVVLLASIALLWKVDNCHESGKSISDGIMSQKLAIRWAIYLMAIIGIMIFGTYGFGFNAQDFIYGGF